jgi:hypothetical protein
MDMETFGLIGAIFAAAAYTTIIGVLVSLAHGSMLQKWVMASVGAVWGVLIVTVAALSGFISGAIGPVPVAVLPFAGLLALFFGSWFLIPKFRSAILSVPLPVLIALNAARLGGVLFLILMAAGNLSAPFAPSAGWGDIITGALAIPLAIVLALGLGIRKIWVGLWNTFGILDLVAAIFLGLFSAPNTPFRIFTEEPGTAALTQLPWIMVPSILVPAYMFIHFVIAVKLRALKR